MDCYHLIADYRYLTERFNRLEFQDAFLGYSEQFHPVSFSGTETMAEAEAFISALERDWQNVRGRFKRNLARDTDRMMITCFFNPAALRFPENMDFVAAIQAVWNRKHPSLSYQLATYEDIMKGFEPKLFGIKLNKDND